MFNQKLNTASLTDKNSGSELGRDREILTWTEKVNDYYDTVCFFFF